MTYITFDTCQICGGLFSAESRVGLAPHFDAEIAPGFIIRTAAYTVYQRCAGCGVWVQNPRLDDESLGRYYGEGIYRATLGITPERIDADEQNRAKYDAALIRDYLPPVTNHLDIGCSRGYLLRAVNAPVMLGVEPNEAWPLASIKTVRDVDHVQGEFDLVTMIHMLEHEPYPLQCLKNATKHLSGGGYLVIEVPSWQSKGGPLRLAHLWHWEDAAMEYMLNLAGLRVERMIKIPHLFVIARIA